MASNANKEQRNERSAKVKRVPNNPTQRRDNDQCRVVWKSKVMVGECFPSRPVITSEGSDFIVATRSLVLVMGNYPFMLEGSLWSLLAFLRNRSRNESWWINRVNRALFLLLYGK